MNVLIVEDHPVMLEGLKGLVAQAFPGHVPASASSFAAAREQVSRADPQLVVVDPHLPDLRGSAAIRGLLSSSPGCRLVVFSGDDHPHDVEEAWEAGAKAFITKAATPADIVAVLRHVARGERVLLTRSGARQFAPPGSGTPAGLSDRQREVLQGLCDGLANKEVATRLGIAEKTVKVHVSAIFDKLGVTNRTQATMVARRLGLARDGDRPPVTRQGFAPAVAH